MDLSKASHTTNDDLLIANFMKIKYAMRYMKSYRANLKQRVSK